MKRFATWALGFAAALSVAGGCASDEIDDESGGQAASKATELEACKMFVVAEGKFVDFNTFAADTKHPERKNDPVLTMLMSDLRAGKTCPKTYKEMQKVSALQSCELKTRIISERTVLFGGVPEHGRALSGRECGGEEKLLFLLDPIDTRNADIPDNVEVMGTNSVDGLFSYYAREEDEKGTMVWKFYGTSADFVTNGYDCDVTKFHGACQSKFAQPGGVPGNKGAVRCASCHPGGGMVQKELNLPWSFWMRDTGDYITKNAKDLGTFQNGDFFEPMTTKLNGIWAKKRAQILAKQSLKDALRPVFCTMDINVQSGGPTARADLMIDLAFASSSFFTNPDGFGGIGSTFIASLDSTTYFAALAANGQRVEQEGPNGNAVPIKQGNADLRESEFDQNLYPERSNLDHQYVAALKNQNIVSEELLKDILAVDFTRPIFSPTRCGLADLADGIDAANAKQGFITKLQAKANKSAGETEFLASLTAPAGKHQTDADAYIAACKARASSDAAGFTTDVVKYVSHLRRVARLPKVKAQVGREEFNLGIIDFDETLPTDNLVQNDPKFNPTTCTLQ